MRRPAPSSLVLAALTLSLLGSSAPTGTKAHNAQRNQIVEAYGNVPLSFEANQGQTDAQVRYFARGEGYAVFLTPAEVVLALAAREAGRNSRAVVRMKLAGASPARRMEALDPLPGKSNYFLGNNPGRWRAAVPSYARIRYAEVYPGISVIYYGNQRRLEYDFVVAPGADARAIEFVFEGVSSMRLNAHGDLLLRSGGVELCQHRPAVFQETQAGRREVGARYALQGRRRAALLLDDYDRSRPLRIDPVLSYSTYLGGDAAIAGGNDYARGLALDAAGNVYVAGVTESTKFPVTANAYGTSAPEAPLNAFVAKLDSTASRLLYSTYLWPDEAAGIAVDPAGSVYVAGTVGPGRCPATQNAFQKDAAGPRNACIAKLDPSGALVYATALGGEGFDSATAIAVDSSGDAYVTGVAGSARFPITPGAFQTKRNGPQDAFITKLNSDGAGLVYSTYLGGTSTDRSNSLAVDSSGKAYVTGQTSSNDFPATPGAFRRSGGGADAFVTKLNAAGSALVYSSLFGGSGSDAGNAIAVDAAGNAYVAGQTSSRDFPISPNALQTAHGGGLLDAFLVELNDRGDAVVYSSYLGGSGNDAANTVTVDSSGNVFVGGQTDSHDFLQHRSVPRQRMPPARRVSAFQAAYGGGPLDAFLVKLNHQGQVYSTYLGGNEEDRIVGLMVDSSGNVCALGYTNSANFPIRPGALQAALLPGGFDAFLTKFSPAGSPLWSTYFGGAGSALLEGALGVAVDSQGAAYITGHTFSTNFPTTAGAMQATLGSNSSSDAFVAKLDPSGHNLVYSTYLGGSKEDTGTAIAVDSAGNAYVTGTTASADFPTTPGAFQTSHGGSSDAFVAKLNPQGAALVYSTLLGGSGQDEALGIKVDSSGSAFVAGGTASTNFPTTQGAFQTAHAGGFLDAFVAKLNPLGTALLYATLLGGEGSDEAFDIAVDSNGNAYLTGVTSSKKFPATSGAYQSAHAGGSSDAFVAKLNSAGSALVYSTFLGGFTEDEGHAIAVDTSGAAYVAGMTTSNNFPVTQGAFQGSFGGRSDAFVTKVNPAGSALEYSTYLGKGSEDRAEGIALDPSGNAYVTGRTTSWNFPTTDDAWQYTLAGACNGFLVKLDAAGKSLLYSTLLGGGGEDRGAGVAVDSSGNQVYIAGQAGSANFPTTPNVIQASPGATRNGFVAKLDFSQATPPGPVISDLTNVMGYHIIAPGAVIAISGERLAGESVNAVNSLLEPLSGPLPTTLGGASVSVGKVAAPLFSVSPATIIAQMPYEASEGTAVTVSVDGRWGRPFSGTVIRPWALSVIRVFKTDLTRVTSDNPVRPGDEMVAYVTGYGATDPPFPSGVPAPDSPPVKVPVELYVQIVQGKSTSARCDVLSFTLAPGLAGIGQIRVRIPTWASSEIQEWDFMVSAEGVESNHVPIYMLSSAP